MIEISFKLALGTLGRTVSDPTSYGYRYASVGVSILKEVVPKTQPIFQLLDCIRDITVVKDFSGLKTPLMKTACCIASLYFYKSVFFLRGVRELGFDAYKVSQAHNTRERMEAIANLCLNILTIATLPSIEVVALVKIIKTGINLKRAYDRYSKDECIESFGDAIIAVIRAMDARKDIAAVYAAHKQNKMRQIEEREWAAKDKNEVTVWHVSPSDYNGFFQKSSQMYLQDDVLKNYNIIKCSARNLNELDTKISEIKSKGLKITNLVLQCHSIPIAAKITNFIIKIPDDPSFDSNDFFQNQTEMRRIPAKGEFEKYEALVNIIKTGTAVGSSIYLLGCSTAVSTKHVRKNMTFSLAQDLPGRKVIGTTVDLGLFDFPKLTASKEILTGSRLKSYSF